MSLPGIYNPTMKRGLTFYRKITYKDSLGVPVDLTGWTGKAQVRATREGGEFALEFNTNDGSMVLGGAAGTIELYKSATETLAVDPSSYRWDVVLTKADGVTTVGIVEGKFESDGRVTE